MWDISTQQVKTQLIAHDKEVRFISCNCRTLVALYI
jgi:hypothetical protein